MNPDHQPGMVFHPTTWKTRLHETIDFLKTCLLMALVFAIVYLWGATQIAPTAC